MEPEELKMLNTQIARINEFRNIANTVVAKGGYAGLFDVWYESAFPEDKPFNVS